MPSTKQEQIAECWASGGIWSQGGCIMPPEGGPGDPDFDDWIAQGKCADEGNLWIDGQCVVRGEGVPGGDDEGGGPGKWIPGDTVDTRWKTPEVPGTQDLTGVSDLMNTLNFQRLWEGYNPDVGLASDSDTFWGMPVGKGIFSTDDPGDKAGRGFIWGDQQDIKSFMPGYNPAESGGMLKTLQGHFAGGGGSGSGSGSGSCPAGQWWDEASQSCKDVGPYHPTPGTCPAGQHYSDLQKRCVLDSTSPGPPAPQMPDPHPND